VVAGEGWGEGKEGKEGKEGRRARTPTKKPYHFPPFFCNIAKLTPPELLKVPTSWLE